MYIIELTISLAAFPLQLGILSFFKFQQFKIHVDMLSLSSVLLLAGSTASNPGICVVEKCAKFLLACEIDPICR